jgi:hypothetical protein
VGALRERIGERLSVLDEVLRGQARHRRLWRGGLAALLLLAVFAALWLGSSRRTPTAGGTLGRARPWAVETGVVTGYIQPCSGTGFPAYASTGARLFSAAALVEALPGQEHPETAADGTYRVVLPTVVASRERVSQNEAFELDDLAPGRYVILAQYAGGNASTYMDVLVAPGQAVTVYLPNTCK